MDEKELPHQSWDIKDSEGNPIIAQWGHPAFDFVSGFSDLFIEDCKAVIDQGCRFMKWDAINTFFSCLPNLDHGSASYSDEEIRARYEYLLPIYVVRAMEILTDYEPELVIEMDLTEARRVMVGLAPLSQGKLFWMNNGASAYNDYSSFRAKSMRIIPNEYAGLIPLELFTYSNYPHNISNSMAYNVNNSILTGHGFWGNLELMTKEERCLIGEKVKQSHKIKPYLTDIVPKVKGAVGDSPEIYEVINHEAAAGQLFVFSDRPVIQDINVDINSDNLLAVLNHSYTVGNHQVKINCKSQNIESSTIAYFIPNKGTGVSIYSSTNSINGANFENGVLKYTCVTSGKQLIKWSEKYGKPTVKSGNATLKLLKEEEGAYEIEISARDNSTIVIERVN